MAPRLLPGRRSAAATMPAAAAALCRCPIRGRRIRGGGAGLGLRGLWRKGREQLGAPHHLAPGVGAREQSAAAVAQYLMRGGGTTSVSKMTIVVGRRWRR
jgi:hypothetical protein